MEEADFMQLVDNELKEYIPKLKRFAKNHTKDQCIEKTGNWWNDYRISDTAEQALDKYIENVLFPG